ncbi:MAG TPA: hypothetical protein VKT78_19720 [Fimbriimonadaceae bacterium]|nr:hypothetical protein [Fimbriimonadaceae bacterium]
MNSPAKVIVGAVLAIVAIWLALHLVFGVIHWVLALVYAALPVLLVVGLGYGLYRVFRPRSLTGGRRILP